MVHHYNGVTSAYSPAELVEIRKELRRENAELLQKLQQLQQLEQAADGVINAYKNDDYLDMQIIALEVVRNERNG